MTNIYGLNIFSSGPWNIFMEPFRSRRFRFHITKTVKGKEWGVNFSLKDVKEGDFPATPTLEGNWEVEELKSFLQAVTDFAHSLGISARDVKDQTDELKAVRCHLEDMRRLVLDK